MTIVVAAQERRGFPAIDPEPAVRRLVDRLLARGERVRVLAGPGRTEGWPAPVAVVPGDVNRPPEGVFAGAGRAFLSGLLPDRAAEVAHAARRAGVRRVVLLSSGAAGIELRHGREQWWFRLAEEAIEESGLEWTHLRPAGLMLDTLGWAPAIRAGEVLREPFADIGYPLLHEDDLADVAAAALLDDGHHGRAYPLTGPEPVSPADQARLIGAAIGREVPFEELTPQQARDRWIALGRPADEVDLELFVMSEYAGRSIPADPTLEHVLGRPGRTYAQWAAEHAADFIPGGAS
ncbi:uncharacterized protein YbjT (DUF2867 family) [Thermocatellispora tengchongensis]|uniref:Uncharacterized protein YbjT (DUF2867 family) n=1 Tax=Thermocatellispora tengchongensis TaxID=1073253 RepID=A0A840PLB6_9ACTN|nr:NAD(P)H-binding protein [Thermocatellispora tengchongensis]MBB5140298.1 uncharacterized protein YbjT (DUF2867 family) [Thermocatellispora tengchongensis]